MQKILVLIDFTQLANVSLNQAIAIARNKNYGLVLCNIAYSENDKEDTELQHALEPYAHKARIEGINTEIQIGHGNFFNAVFAIVDRVRPALVIVGTHGKIGLKQMLFGSNIYKLIKGIHAPALVLNEHSPIIEGGYKRVVMPVSHHEDYLTMINQVCELVAKDGKLIIFAIVKYGLPLDKEIVNNIEAAKKHLTAKGIEWDYLEMDSDKYSAGYSKETLAYLKGHEIDLIAIISKVSAQNAAFGMIDKENILLNETGLPVLCSGHSE